MKKISYLFKITTEKEELFTKQKYIDGTGEIEVSSRYVSIIKVSHFDHILTNICQCSVLLYRFVRIGKVIRRNMRCSPNTYTDTITIFESVNI